MSVSISLALCVFLIACACGSTNYGVSELGDNFHSLRSELKLKGEGVF